jgi:putative ABC transport system permease protein
MAVLTILAVAAATALAVGVEIASRAVREELHETARAILGDADLEVVAGNRGIPEALIEKVASVPGVFEASPVITEVVRIAGGPLDGLALSLPGFDLLAKRQMRKVEVTRDRVTIRDPLRLLVRPNSVVIAGSLAERLGVREGQSFRVDSPVGVHDLVVEGLIAPGGLGDAYGGQIAVMDVWALQHLLGARGFVDRIELTVAPDHDPEALLPLVQERVAGIATTRTVLERESWPVSGSAYWT